MWAKRNYKGKCIGCGKKFTKEDYAKAEKGEFGSPVGDWDDVCYPCQFRGVESNQKRFATQGTHDIK